MKCNDYICDDEECRDICTDCERMSERSCVNCAMKEDCDGDSEFHDKLDYDEYSAQT